jgi:hypothetical protein
MIELSRKIIELIENTRQNIARNTNRAMLVTYLFLMRIDDHFERQFYEKKIDKIEMEKNT